jgi:hypothetical protein
MATPSDTQDLLDKIRALPDDKIAEVIDFVEFLQLKSDEHRLKTATAALSEQAFQKVWDNPDDAEYDEL